MLKTYEIALDIEKELYSPSNLLFSISNNDLETIELTFKISQDDTRLNLTGTTVELAIKKPSGLTVYQTCEIVDAIQGEAKTMLSNQGYIEFGFHMAEIYVKTIDQIAVTSPFWYMSRSAVMNDETIESVNEWSAFQMALFAYDLKPIITNGFPTNTPEYVGQMAFDAINKIAYIANDLTSVSWQEIGTGEGGGGGSDTVLGITAPASTPARIGQIYIDTIGKAAYIATGATSGDWEQIDVAGLTSITWDEVTEKPIVFPPDLLEPDLLALFAAKAAIDHNHDLVYAPIDHDHLSADITDLNTVVDGKITTALSGYTPTIPTEYLTDTEANLAYAPIVHNHDADYYRKTETYNSGEIDDIVTGITQGGGTVVVDDLASISTTAALSANQGRILKGEVDAKAAIDHDHLSADITDLTTTIDGQITTALSGYTPTIPTEYLTDTEANLAYAPIVHNHDLVYAPIDHDHLSADITDLNTVVDGKISTALSGYTPTIPTEYLTDTEANLAYAPIVHNHDLVYAPLDHDHLSADITDLNTVVDGKISTALSGYTPTIPTEYLTDTEANLAYAPIVHNHDADYYKKTETYSSGEVDDIVTGITQGGGTTVVDNLISVSTTAALSANQGRVLKGEVDAKAAIDHNHDLVYAPIDHDHLSADITDLNTVVDGKISTALSGYTPTIPTEYLTDTEANLAYAPIVHNHDLVYAPIDHDHVSADITDLTTTIDGQITTALSGYTPTIPTEYLTDTEANLAYAPIVHNHDLVYAPLDHDHLSADITDLTTTIDGQITTALSGYTPTIPTEYLTDTEANLAYAPIVHNHDLVYAPIDHDHLSADITDLNTVVDGKISTALSGYTPTIPTEYLTDTEANLAYAPIVHNHDLVYAPIDHDHLSADITDLTTTIDGQITTALSGYTPTIPTEYLTDTEANLAYAPIVHNHDLVYAPLDHDHLSADITDLTTTIDGQITTALSGYTPTIPNATTGTTGGVKVGNGLRMGGTNNEWLTLRDGVGIKTNSVSLAVDVDKPTLDGWYAKSTQGLSIWSGTQADYDLLTPDATTLYFITG